MYAKTQLILLFLFSTLNGQVKIGDWGAYTSPLKINKTILKCIKFIDYQFLKFLELKIVNIIFNHIHLFYIIY